MPRLYQRQGAGRPLRVRWALEEIGAPYDWIVMDQAEGRSEEHLRRQPLGRVPAFETDDGMLFESAAICLHIADQHADAGLIPPLGSYERGQVYQWSFFAMTELEPAMLRAYTVRRGDDAAATEKANARLDKVGRVVGDHLDGADFLVGGRFTIADVVMGGVLHNAREYEVFPEDARLLTYLESLDARPAKQRAYTV